MWHSFLDEQKNEWIWIRVLEERDPSFSVPRFESVSPYGSPLILSASSPLPDSSPASDQNFHLGVGGLEGRAERNMGSTEKKKYGKKRGGYSV